MHMYGAVCLSGLFSVTGIDKNHSYSEDIWRIWNVICISPEEKSVSGNGADFLRFGGQRFRVLQAHCSNMYNCFRKMGVMTYVADEKYNDYT